MPKGKKFDAAEKHFMNKEESYQKQIKHLRELHGEKCDRIKTLEKELSEANIDNANKEAVIKHLSLLCDMNPEEKEEYLNKLESEKRLSESISTLLGFSSLCSGILRRY